MGCPVPSCPGHEALHARLDVAVERLIAATSERNEAWSTLRSIAEAEGEGSLGHEVVIWRAKAAAETRRAEQVGTRCALAELCIRRLLAHKPCTTELANWQQAVDDMEAAS